MAIRATGPFDVKLAPLDPYNKDDGASLARMPIDKEFRGELSARSRGEMLAVGTAVKGSAGYVAVERVTGTLHGKRGSFALQHNGTMTRGEPMMNVIVVPDSGAGELEGLTGKMTIIIAPDGAHSYEFDYAIEARH